MKVFADLHHFDLFYSLQLLFQKRLGWELYRPIGLDWYDANLWNVYPSRTTAGQYLDFNSSKLISNGIYACFDHSKNDYQMAVTLDYFKNTKFDILISSIPQHVSIFSRLINEFQPQAKHIFQIGNSWNVPNGIKNAMISCAPFQIPPNINHVFYHQEFDLNIFKYEEPTNHNKINSYIQFMGNLPFLYAHKQALPDFNFMTYGGGMESNISKTNDIAKTMLESAFTWHVKQADDGYGFSLHNTYACGRPAITSFHHYFNMGKRNGKFLLEDQVTAINLDQHSVQQNAQIIRKWAEPENHLKMCQAAYRRFKQVVDFDNEFEQIKKFLENLL